MFMNEFLNNESEELDISRFAKIADSIMEGLVTFVTGPFTVSLVLPQKGELYSMRRRLVETDKPGVFKLVKEEEAMKTKIITFTINYPETNFDEDNIERYVLEALSGSDDLRDCGGEILDIRDYTPNKEEGDA